MIISRTPYRISFFGGGTDYPEWYRENGGSVLVTSIDKYCYLSCRILPPFFEHKHRIVYSKVENVSRIDQIEHPAVREILKYMGITDGLEIHHDGDLPARSGMGSSSSFTVGLLNTLFALRGQQISRHELARRAIHIEQNIINEMVGSQDQIATAIGGLNRISFHQSGDFDVEPFIIPTPRRRELEDSLLMFFTGISRLAPEIAKAKITNFKHRRTELMAMGQMVEEGVNRLLSQNAPITEFGELMHESWMLKRRLSEKVSSARIDQIYEAGLKAGASGGKILGAGGGGFILFLAAPEHHARIREALRDLTEVSFHFENQGSRIVLYEPDLMGRREESPTFASSYVPPAQPSDNPPVSLHQ